MPSPKRLRTDAVALPAGYVHPRLPLAEKYALARENDICFRAEDHTYKIYINGKWVLAVASASAVAAKCFEVFDADERIGFMFGSSGWTNSVYRADYWEQRKDEVLAALRAWKTTDMTSVFLSLQLQAMLGVEHEAELKDYVQAAHHIMTTYIPVDRTEIDEDIEVFDDDEFEGDDALLALVSGAPARQADMVLGELELHPLVIAAHPPLRNLDRDWDEDLDAVRAWIKAKWVANGAQASALGTHMHDVLERYLNGLGLPAEERAKPEIRQFLEFEKFFMKLHNIEVYRTEIMLHTDEQYLLCGMVDVLAVKRNQPNPDVLDLYILDHKRSKEIHMTGGKPGKPPLAHLKDNNFTKYSLAMSFYAWVLMKYYRDFPYNGHVYKTCNVSRMFLDVCHPNQITYNAIEVKPLYADLEKVLKLFEIRQEL